MTNWLSIQSWSKKSIYILMLIALFNSMINVGVIVSEDLAHHESIDWSFYIINECTGSFMLLLFIPPLFWFYDRFPLQWRILPLYVLASIIFGGLYTTFMYGARVPLYGLAGITRLDEIFNDLPYRYLMEYFKQFFTFWLVYVVFWAINQYEKNQQRELRENTLRSDLLQAQLVGLQRQLHPHFFFNTLNTISSLMYKYPAKADHLISRMSDFLRSVIGLGEHIFHSVSKEVDLLRQYVDVMIARYGERMIVVFDVDMHAESLPMPVLLLQPIVENAVLYSIDHQETAHICIQIKTKNDRINVIVKDNGPGIREGFSMGTGLNTVMEKLQKIYPHEHEIRFENLEGGGLQVFIDIPIAGHD